MRTGVVLLAIASMIALMSKPAMSQVRIGVQIRVPGAVMVLHRVPLPGAVWVPGHWVWNEYAGANVWVEGLWIASNPAPRWHEREMRHIPHGVAKGWWRKHGGEWRRDSYRDRHEERDGD